MKKALEQSGRLIVESGQNKKTSYAKKIFAFHGKLSQLSDSSFVFRYVFALLAVAFVVGAKYLFFPPYDVPFLLVWLAIIVSALYGGMMSGLLATVITVLLVNFLFIPAQFTFKISHLIFVESLIYVSLGTLVSFLIERERIERKKSYVQAEQLRVTLASIGDAVITTNVDGNIIFMNKVAENLTGWRNSEVAGKRLESVFNIANERTKKKVGNPVKKVMKKNKIVGLANHTVLIRKDGRFMPIDDSAAPIRDTSGNLIGVILIFRDVTQKRQLEQKKDDFVSIASHELRTPVTSIKLFTQFLKKKLSKNKDKEMVKILENVDGQVKKLTDLINDLLDLSKMQSKKPNYKKQMLSIDNLARETIKNLRQIYPSHDFILEGSVGKKVHADRDRIRQVLVNLISNAVKYSNGNKKVLIKLEKSESNIIVGIQDFGTGIPSDQLDKIFDRFYQVGTRKSKSNPGLGLGLYISSEIIKGHKGKIWVDSRVGEGSTFQFSLPTN